MDNNAAFLIADKDLDPPTVWHDAKADPPVIDGTYIIIIDYPGCEDDPMIVDYIVDVGWNCKRMTDGSVYTKSRMDDVLAWTYVPHFRREDIEQVREDF